ncbi:MAG: MFS transporter [Saccharofermentanales bacterium]
MLSRHIRRVIQFGQKISKSKSTSGQARDRLWTRQFILITFINLLIFFGFQLITPTLPVHIKNLGAGDNMVGWVNGVFTIATLLIRPFIGVGLDRLGRKGIFLSGLLVFIAITASYTWLSTVALILFFRFIHGFGWGALNTAANTIATDIIPVSRFGEGMGYFTLASNVAMAISPSIGLYIIAKCSFQAASLLSSGLLLLGLVFSFALKYRRIEQQDQPIKKAALFEKTAIRPSIIIFFVTITYGVVNSFLALYAIERGIANGGMFFTVMAIALVVSRPVFGMVVDRFNYGYAIIPGLLSIIFSMSVLAQTSTLSLLLVSGAAYGVGFGAAQTSLQAMAVSEAPRDRLGAANSTFFTAFDSGIGVGSILLGNVAAAFGYSKMFLWSIAPVVLALLLFLFLTGRAKA